MSEYRERIEAAIIRNKQLLLVTGLGRSIYWTPGGQIDPGENREEALRRELLEELGIAVTKFNHYYKYQSDKEGVFDAANNECFLIDYDGNIQCGNEITEFKWFSREDASDPATIAIGAREYLVPKLIEDGLL